MKRAIIDGKQLRGAIADAGASQREFAELVGTREATISQAINGKVLGFEIVAAILVGLQALELRPKTSKRR